MVCWTTNAQVHVHTCADVTDMSRPQAHPTCLCYIMLLWVSWYICCCTFIVHLTCWQEFAESPALSKNVLQLLSHCRSSTEIRLICALQATLVAVQRHMLRASGTLQQSILSHAPGFRECCGIAPLPRSLC